MATRIPARKMSAWSMNFSPLAACRQSYAGNYGEQSNDTRQLPEGVSQADAAVLANGYLYQVQDGELTILQAQGADTVVVCSTGVTADPAGYDNYERNSPGRGSLR